MFAKIFFNIWDYTKQISAKIHKSKIYKDSCVLFIQSNKLGMLSHEKEVKK